MTSHPLLAVVICNFFNCTKLVLPFMPNEIPFIEISSSIFTPIVPSCRGVLVEHTHKCCHNTPWGVKHLTPLGGVPAD